MKISGQSSKDGIKFIGEKSYVVAKINKEGKQVIKLVKANNKLKNIISDIPILKYYLGSMKSIICSLILLLVCILIDFYTNGNIKLNIDLVGVLYIVTGGCIYLLYFALFCRSFFGFHGAEHKAINSYTLYNDVSLESIKKSSRISNGCSTNCLLLYLFILLVSYMLLGKLYITFMFINYGISRQLFMVKDINKNYLFTLVFKVGYLIQSRFITKEPTDDQLILAKNAIRKLIENEENIGYIG